MNDAESGNIDRKNRRANTINFHFSCIQMHTHDARRTKDEENGDWDRGSHTTAQQHSIIIIKIKIKTLKVRRSITQCKRKMLKITIT